MNKTDQGKSENSEKGERGIHENENTSNTKENTTQIVYSYEP
jgi:hypothetical protein